MQIVVVSYLMLGTLSLLTEIICNRRTPNQISFLQNVLNMLKVVHTIATQFFTKLVVNAVLFLIKHCYMCLAGALVMMVRKYACLVTQRCLIQFPLAARTCHLMARAARGNISTGPFCV